MNTEDLASNNRSDGQAVERIYKALPNLNVAPSLTFIIEAIHASDVSALVVASKQEKVLRVFELIAHQQKNGLQMFSHQRHVRNVGCRGYRYFCSCFYSSISPIGGELTLSTELMTA